MSSSIGISQSARASENEPPQSHTCCHYGRRSFGLDGTQLHRADPAGNRKLDKKRAAGGIDGMTALAMALAAAPAAWTQTVDAATLIG